MQFQICGFDWIFCLVRLAAENISLEVYKFLEKYGKNVCSLNKMIYKTFTSFSIQVADASLIRGNLSWARDQNVDTGFLV